MILPIVEVRLRDPDWRLRESAILAIGAVSEGCGAGLTPFLPQLIEFLVPSLDDPRPMVRPVHAPQTPQPPSTTLNHPYTVLILPLYTPQTPFIHFWVRQLTAHSHRLRHRRCV
jgi:hypothetical protein